MASRGLWAGLLAVRWVAVRRWWAVVLVVGVAVVALSLVAPTLLSGSGGGGVVRAGTLLGGISTLDVMESLGLGERYGFRLEVYRFQKTPEILVALERGEVDVAVIPAEMAAKLIQRGVDIVVVAVDMLQNQAILSLDPGLSGPEALEGRVVGAVLPSGTYKLFKAYMKLCCGLEVVEEGEPGPGRVRAVNIEPGGLIAALKRGDVDAIVAWEPIVSRALVAGARVVAEYRELWGMVGARGEPVMLVYAARGSWVRENPGLAEAFASARLEAARAWKSDPALVERILTETYRLSGEEAEKLYSRVVVVDKPLDEELVESIREEWRIAWLGGYLAEDPSQIPSTVFYTAGR